MVTLNVCKSPIRHQVQIKGQSEWWLQMAIFYTLGVYLNRYEFILTVSPLSVSYVNEWMHTNYNFVILRTLPTSWERHNLCDSKHTVEIQAPDIETPKYFFEAKLVINLVCLPKRGCPNCYIDLQSKPLCVTSMLLANRRKGRRQFILITYLTRVFKSRGIFDWAINWSGFSGPMTQSVGRAVMHYNLHFICIVYIYCLYGTLLIWIESGI